ncbi:hypothetical protein P8452_29299 [Trifolium repens]|nr:hypothetical protein P8452_29299 [Trifolium repens]
MSPSDSVYVFMATSSFDSDCRHSFNPTRQTLDLDFIIGRSTIVPCSRRLATAPDLLLTFLENQSILFLLKQRKSNLYVRSGFAANSCD